MRLPGLFCSMRGIHRAPLLPGDALALFAACAPVRLGNRPFRRACGGIFTCCRAGIPCAPFRCLCALAPVCLGKRPFRRAGGGIFPRRRAGELLCLRRVFTAGAVFFASAGMVKSPRAVCARAPFSPCAALAPACLGKTRFPPRVRRNFCVPCGLGMRCRLQSRIVRIRVPLPHPAYPPHNFSQEGGFFT